MDYMHSMDTHWARGFICTMANDQGLKPVFHKDMIGPYTNALTGEIHVSAPQWSWTPAMFEVWLGEIVHELGHHKGYCKEDMQYFVDKKIDMGTLYGKVINMLTDWRNDWQWHIDLFDGSHEYVSAAQEYHCTRGIDSLEGKALPDDAKAMLLLKLFSWIYNRRAVEFQKRLLEPAMRWAELIPHTYDKFNKELVDMDSPEAIETLARKLFAEEEMDSKENGDKEYTEGDESDEGDDKSQDENKDGDKDGKDEGKGKKDEVWISYKDLLMDDHDATVSAKGECKTHIKYNHDWSATYVPFEKYDEYIMRKTCTRHDKDWWVEQAEGIAAKSASLANQVKRLILVKTEDDNLYEQRRGRLHSRSLHKVPVGGEDIYKRRVSPQKARDSAATFLLDASGSMGGQRWMAACASAILLNDCCKKIGLPFEILAFTETSKTPQYFVVKEWGERLDQDTLCYRLSEITDRMGDNPDGEALMWAYKRLAVRPEKKKILVVLSDGSPVTRAKGDAAYHLKCVASRIEKRCDLFAIGLQTTSVADFYSNYVIINDPEELEGMFLKFIKTKIIG